MAGLPVRNVEATRTLLSAAADAGVSRFVQVGAAAVVMGDLAPMPHVKAGA